MRKTQKVFSLLLSMVLALALCVPAFASEVSSESERTANGSKVIVPLNPDEIVDFTEVLSAMPPIDLGSPDMAEYDNSPNIQTRASGFLFSMTANEVYDLLTTGSNKTFSCYDLSNDYLYIRGSLSHSTEPDASIKIGGCYYNSATGTYKADVYDFVSPGTISVSINTQYSIAREYEHRGFIKNDIGTGYVHGNLSFYGKL